jgi:hypothetical protein
MAVKKHKLAKWDDFRTFKWIDSVKQSEFLLEQIKGLLQL